MATRGICFALLATSTICELTACSSTSYVVVGQTHQRISPDQVKVYLQPPAKYEEVALLTGDSLNSWHLTGQGKMEEAINRMKANAAKLGANGIILTGVGNQYNGSVGASGVTATRGGAVGFGAAIPVMVKSASGIAIYVAGENDLPTVLPNTGSTSPLRAAVVATTNTAPSSRPLPPAAPQAAATPVASHVRLGVHCMQVTPELAQTDHLPVDVGVRVATVEAGSVAEAGGIEVGDVLLKYGDRSLNEISDLTAAIAATTPGASVPITVWRRTGESVVDVQF
jgi:hypothetical protein